MANKLILFRGWPGSGKTSAINRMFPGIFHVENDMYHIHNGNYEWQAKNMSSAISWCVDMVNTALKNNMDVCVANTFTKRKFIEKYKKLADKYNADFVVYRCTGNFTNVHNIASNVVNSFKQSMEDWPGEILVDND